MRPWPGWQWLPASLVACGGGELGRGSRAGRFWSTRQPEPDVGWLYYAQAALSSVTPTKAPHPAPPLTVPVSSSYSRDPKLHQSQASVSSEIPPTSAGARTQMSPPSSYPDTAHPLCPPHPSPTRFTHTKAPSLPGAL